MQFLSAFFLLMCGVLLAACLCSLEHFYFRYIRFSPLFISSKSHSDLVWVARNVYIGCVEEISGIQYPVNILNSSCAKKNCSIIFLYYFLNSMKHNYIIICLDSMFETFCVESWNSIWLLFRLRAFLLPFQHLCLKLLLPFQLQFNPAQLTAPIPWNPQTTNISPIISFFCGILCAWPSNYRKIDHNWMFFKQNCLEKKTDQIAMKKWKKNTCPRQFWVSFLIRPSNRENVNIIV